MFQLTTEIKYLEIDLRGAVKDKAPQGRSKGMNESQDSQGNLTE